MDAIATAGITRPVTVRNSNTPPMSMRNIITHGADVGYSRDNVDNTWKSCMTGKYR